MSAQSTGSEGAIRPLLAWHDHRVAHGFLGRRGGVSRGAYATLNLSYFVGDDPGAVRANWDRLCGVLDRHNGMALLNQVHGDSVHTIGPGYRGERLGGDGMVTAAAGVILGIMTADCVPVLMMDHERRVAGALHAGWRGIVADISRAGLAAMTAAGARPDRIEVALGPAIGACCFEVDVALARRFESQIPGAAAHIRPGAAGKAFIDLKRVIAYQFRCGGIEPGAITNVGPCTRCAKDDYFSRRGASGAVTGLQLSFIGFGG